MKKTLFLLLTYGMFVSSYSQSVPGEPCCNVIGIDAVKSIVTVRDKTTGRLIQFKADAMDMRGLRIGDAVDFGVSKISAINGSTRTYGTFQPDYVEPCCNVVSIQVDGIAPCCNVVTLKNTATNKIFQLSVPKAVAATFKVGQAASIDAGNSLVVLQSSYGGSKGELNTYGYPMTSADINKNELEPCCNILSLNSADNTALIRNESTGRLYKFKADNMDMRSLKKGDAVSITTNKISAINGSTRTYGTFQPDYQEPCCGVVNIQVDGIEPCCNVVTIKNAATNKTFQLSVPKAVAATFKVGQAVSIDAGNNLAVLQSSYGGNNGEMNAYGYPVESGEGETNEGASSAKWVITPVTNMKGVLGRLDINFPADVERNILIYQPTDNKFITSVSRNDKTYTIAPGEYNFVLSSVPVENVPIQKGHETRLKAGFLIIVSEGNWHLYDETKEKA